VSSARLTFALPEISGDSAEISIAFKGILAQFAAPKKPFLAIHAKKMWTAGILLASRANCSRSTGNFV
jgi:hypothetical protein